MQLKAFCFVLASLLTFSCKNESTLDLDPRLKEVHNFWAWNTESKDSLSKAILMLDEVPGSSNYKSYLYLLVYIHLEDYSKAFEIVTDEYYLENNQSPYIFLIAGALMEVENNQIDAIRYYEKAKYSNNKILDEKKENFRQDLISWLIINDDDSFKQLTSKYKKSESWDIQAFLNLLKKNSREDFLKAFLKSLT